MRFLTIALSSLLVLGLVWSNSAFGQTTEDEIKALKGEIADMKTVIQRILAGRRVVDRLLADAIVLTGQDCAVLGPDWRRYEGMGGRFPLAAGQTIDTREETIPFTLGQNGGAYKHQLTVEEMPKHRHSYRVYHEHSRRCSGDCGARVPQSNDSTGEAGGDQPHNNMPPYLVMNFCHKSGTP